MRYKITSLWFELNKGIITPFYAEGLSEPARVGEDPVGFIVKKVRFSFPVVARNRLMISLFVLICLLKLVERNYLPFKPIYGDCIWWLYMPTHRFLRLFSNDILNLQVFMVGLLNWLGCED